MNRSVALGGIALLIALIAGGALIYQERQVSRLSTSVSALQGSIATLANSLATTASTSQATAAANSSAISELSRRGQVVQSSQGDQLQRAVAKVTPAVVSIVESKEVPKLKVTYENPFGNDPFFQGIGAQVPVYQQVGTAVKEVAAGTGFLIRSNGYIATNKHVVPDTNATYTVLLSNGTQKQASVVWRSANDDIAIVKIDGSGYSTVPLSKSSDLALGQSVFAVGNALGKYNNSVSVGVISGLNRDISAETDTGTIEKFTGVIQTDAAVNLGNSGGPLVNLNGEAVGINTAMVEGSVNIGFALPISRVSQAISSLGI